MPDLPLPEIRVVKEVEIRERHFTEFVFQTGTCLVNDQLILHYFPDGVTNIFHIGPCMDEEYKRNAKFHGYTNHIRYAIEHELTHHYVADLMGFPHSYSLYENPPLDKWPQHVHDEEHLVNSLQRFAKLGKLDDYGVLKWRFGHRLPELRSELRNFYSKIPDRYWARKLPTIHKAG